MPYMKATSVDHFKLYIKYLLLSHLDILSTFHIRKGLSPPIHYDLKFKTNFFHQIYQNLITQTEKRPPSPLPIGFSDGGRKQKGTPWWGQTCQAMKRELKKKWCKVRSPINEHKTHK